MTSNLFSNKKLAIALHVLAWLIIIIIPRFIFYAYGDAHDRFLFHFYANTLIYGALFYFNYLYLVPHFYHRDNKLWYFLLATAATLFWVLALWYVNDHIFYDPGFEAKMDKVMQELNKGKTVVKPPIRQFRLFNYFYTSFLITGFSLGLGVLQRLTQNEKKRKELEKEKLNSELAFLKNQVSPHFFFNTLNNIYSLIEIDKTEAQASVHKLSKLMRYLLYESESGFTSLGAEIDFLRNYIDLMKLRLSTKVKLTVALPDHDLDLSIPPLLFIPFVENAFKHGVSYREKSFIDIQINVINQKITMVVRNSIGKSSHEEDEYHSGIGLENVKKRLNLLYPDNYDLNINEDSSVYEVSLKLNTKHPNS